MPLSKRNQNLDSENNILLKYNLSGSQTRLCSVTAAQLSTDFNQLIRQRWWRIRRQVTRLCEFWYHNAIYDVLSVSFKGTEFRTSSNEYKIIYCQNHPTPLHVTSSLFPIPKRPTYMPVLNICVVILIVIDVTWHDIDIKLKSYLPVDKSIVPVVQAIKDLGKQLGNSRARHSESWITLLGRCRRWRRRRWWWIWKVGYSRTLASVSINGLALKRWERVEKESLYAGRGGLLRPVGDALESQRPKTSVTPDAIPCNLGRLRSFNGEFWRFAGNESSPALIMQITVVVIHNTVPLQHHWTSLKKQSDDR